jgi:hypothetical protein
MQPSDERAIDQFMWNPDVVGDVKVLVWLRFALLKPYHRVYSLFDTIRRASIVLHPVFNIDMTPIEFCSTPAVCLKIGTLD